MFLIFPMSRDYISLQAPCQVCIDRLTRLEPPISRSLVSDFQTHLILLRSHTVLLLLRSISFHVHDRIMNYGRSKMWLDSTNLVVQNLETKKCWDFRFFEENRSYPSSEFLAAPYYLYLKTKSFPFFHIQGLHTGGKGSPRSLLSPGGLDFMPISPSRVLRENHPRQTIIKNSCRDNHKTK
jgi:hypothetical protein